MVILMVKFTFSGIHRVGRGGREVAHLGIPIDRDQDSVEPIRWWQFHDEVVGNVRPWFVGDR